MKISITIFNIVAGDAETINGKPGFKSGLQKLIYSKKSASGFSVIRYIASFNSEICSLKRWKAISKNNYLKPCLTAKRNHSASCQQAPSAADPRLPWRAAISKRHRRWHQPPSSDPGRLSLALGEISFASSESVPPIPAKYR